MYIFESTKNISRLFYWLLKNHVYPKTVQTEVQNNGKIIYRAALHHQRLSIIAQGGDDIGL